MLKRFRSSLLLVLFFSFFVARTALALGMPSATLEEVKESSKIDAVTEVLEAHELAESENQQSFENLNTSALRNVQANIILALTSGTPENGKLSGGLLQTTSGLMADMYSNPAASGQTYIADVMNSARLVGAQPAYAQGQGLGFSALSPILGIWKIFRNIAYFFFILIFVVIGFMIMFRQKISGQAVVTAQQAIPNIIVALLMVTFSYAIAGFLIDLMYLFMFLLVSIFQKNGAVFIDGNFLQLGWAIIGPNAVDMGEHVGAFVNDSLGGGIISNIAGIISGLSVALIFAIAIAFGMFRLFFNLLKRYIAVVLGVVTAPLVLMMGAIPGQNTFGPWIKGIIGNLAAFPILLLALIISDTITGNISGHSQGVIYGGFMPPYLGGSGSVGTLSFLLGVGMLLALSELVDMGASALGAGKSPFDAIVAAAGKNLAAGAPLGAKIMGTATGVGLGFGVGTAIGMRDNRALRTSDPEAYRRKVNATRLRYMGNYADMGAGFGAGVSSAVGGKTPGMFAPIEKGFDGFTKGLGEEAVLKRSAQIEGGVWPRIRNVGALSAKEYNRRLQFNEANRARQLALQKALADGDLEAAKKLSLVQD